MNRMREFRERLGMTQGAASVRMKEAEPRIDGAMVCRYEKGTCLPTKGQMEVLEAVLGADRTEIWEIGELDLLGIGQTVTTPEGAVTGGRPKKDRRSREYFRKCFRISRQFEESLPEDLLEKCGYASWQSWFDSGMRRLLAEYEARKRGNRHE